MSKFIGRLVNLGIARETSRGTPVAATFWVPKTAFSFDVKAEKIFSSETLGDITDSSEAYIVSKWGEGAIDGEVRDKSFGLFLHALLGSLSSALVGSDTYDHTFTLATTSNQHTSLSLTVDDPIGDYRFALAMLNSLTITVKVGEMITYAAEFISKEGNLFSATASYTAENKFVAKHAKFLQAATLGALSAETSIKSFSITFAKNVVRDNVLGTIEPEDILNQAFNVTGTLELNHEDNTFRDFLIAESYRAIRLIATNNDVTLTGGYNPTLTINLPRVQFFDWTPNRANDEIVTQTLSFRAMKDVSASLNIVSSIVLRNEQTSY